MAYIREYPPGLEGGPFAKSRSQLEDFTHIDLGVHCALKSLLSKWHLMVDW